MDKFQVEPAALETFASTSMSRNHAFDQLRTQMTAVELPRDAFGHIPGIGGRIHDAYEDFTHQTTDSLSSAAESMAQIAAAVRGVIVAYQNTDNAPQTAYSVIETDMGTIDIRGLQ